MNTRFTRSRIIRLAIVVGSLAAMMAGTVVATGAFGAISSGDRGHGHGRRVHGHVVRASVPRWHFSIFSHPAMAHAHSAGVGGVSAPEGAVFAHTSQVDGVANELYAWHRSPQEDCLVDVEGGREVTTGCSPSSVAEADGLSWAGGVPGANVHVVVMVPDGIPKVEVTSANGLTTAVEVVNNVAAYSATSVKELRYTLPNGSVQSHDFGHNYE